MAEHLRKLISSLLAFLLAAALSPLLPALATGSASASENSASDQADTSGTLSIEAAEEATGIDVSQEGIAYAAGEVLVSFANGTTKAQADEAIRGTNALASDEIADNNLIASSDEGGTLLADQGGEAMVLLEVTDGSTVAQAVAELENDPNVVSAQPNYIYHLIDGDLEGYETEAASAAEDLISTQSTGINDPFRGYQWQLNACSGTSYGVGCYDAWDTAKCNGSVAVAVIDTGCLATHEDLAGNIVGAYNSVSKTSGNSAASDADGHGTHVCGIIAATANNSKGGAGVSYNAKVVPIKAIDTDGYFNTDGLVKAYAYILSVADDYNIRVVNMSLGGNGTTSKDGWLEEQIDAANAAGILTVCAAGNSDIAPVPYAEYPGDYATCLSVINIAEGGSRPASSNYNVSGSTDKDISAPGTSILSTYKTGGYAYMTGTSMASPAVAGVAALVFAANESLTPDQCKQVLYETARDLGASGWDEEYGYGEVNAAAAVRAAAGYTVKFVDWDGTVLKTQSIAYGGTATPPANPTRTGYAFKGWSGSYASVKSDVTITATYTQNQYTITASAGNGGSISPSGSVNAVYDTPQAFTITPAASYAIADVTVDGKSVGAVSSYTFSKISSNHTIAASFIIGHTVTFVDYNGTVLKQEAVLDGKNATPPSSPTRTGYSFSGWSGSYTNVTSDATITATYSLNTYKITATAGAGGSISPSGIIDATYITPQTFTISTEDGYAIADVKVDSASLGIIGTYTFKNITASHTISVSFVKTHVVKFLDWDGTVLKTQIIKDGDDATPPGSPTRNGYKFTGWSGAYANVTSDLSIVAQYSLVASVASLAGDGRYDTMAAIVGASSYKAGGVVVVASGENFPDALAASALAGALNAPVVLTHPAFLSAQARRVMTALAPSKVYVVGGTSAVSSATVDEINELSSKPSVTRISGNDRYDTAVRIYTQGKSSFGLGYSTSTCIIATGRNASKGADALAISPYAYATKTPVFLAQDDGMLAAGTAATIASSNFTHIIVCGGTGVVSNGIKQQLATLGLSASYTRLGGASRYETARSIAEWESGGIVSNNGTSYSNVGFKASSSEVNAGKTLSFATIAVATGANFPDALASAALVGGKGGVLLLANPDDASGGTAIAGTLASRGSTTATCYFIGGTSALPMSVRNIVEGFIE